MLNPKWSPIPQTYLWPNNDRSEYIGGFPHVSGTPFLSPHPLSYLVDPTLIQTVRHVSLHQHPQPQMHQSRLCVGRLKLSKMNLDYSVFIIAKLSHLTVPFRPLPMQPHAWMARIRASVWIIHSTLIQMRTHSYSGTGTGTMGARSRERVLSNCLRSLGVQTSAQKTSGTVSGLQSIANWEIRVKGNQKLPGGITPRSLFPHHFTAVVKTLVPRFTPSQTFIPALCYPSYATIF